MVYYAKRAKHFSKCRRMCNAKLCGVKQQQFQIRNAISYVPKIFPPSDFLLPTINMVWNLQTNNSRGSFYGMTEGQVRTMVNNNYKIILLINLSTGHGAIYQMQYAGIMLIFKRVTICRLSLTYFKIWFVNCI